MGEPAPGDPAVAEDEKEWAYLRRGRPPQTFIFGGKAYQQPLPAAPEKSGQPASEPTMRGVCLGQYKRPH